MLDGEKPASRVEETLDVVEINLVAKMNQSEANSQQGFDAGVALLTILEAAEIALVQVRELGDLIASSVSFFEKLAKDLGEVLVEKPGFHPTSSLGYS